MIHTGNEITLDRSSRPWTTKPGAILWRSTKDRAWVVVIARLLDKLRTALGTLMASAIAAALCGLLLHPRGYVVMAGLLGLLATGIAWPWISVKGVVGRIEFDRHRCREGDLVEVRMSIRNRLPLDAWGLAVDCGFSAEVEREALSARRTGIAQLRGRRNTELSWSERPACRGIYPLATASLATGFPFGIRECARQIDVDHRLIVWPRTYPVGPIPALGNQAPGGVTESPRPGTEGDLTGVRPYRRGDSLKRIHWAQTARHNRLVICERQAAAMARIQIVLDTHPGAHAGEGANGSLEWTIRAAASFFEGWTDQGASVDVVVQRDAFSPLGEPPRTYRTRVLDRLADIRPDDELTLSDLLASHACLSFRTGLRLVLTTDRGLCACRSACAGDVVERYVVLAAGRFGEPAMPGQDRLAALSPWIWIDDPTRVPQALKRLQKGPSLAS